MQFAILQITISMDFSKNIHLGYPSIMITNLKSAICKSRLRKHLKKHFVINSMTTSKEQATKNYFTSMPNSALEKARRSMAIISVDMYSKHPFVGGAVVARRNNGKYLVAASHSTGDIAYREHSPHKAYWPIGVAYLEGLKMLYSTPIAQKSGNLPIADIAIFEFPFNSIEPVEISETLPINPIITVSLGFPVDAINMWKQNRLPVARSGLAYTSRRTQKELNPYGTIDLDRCANEVTAEILTSGGSSGGGLFDMQGNLLAICRGYKKDNPEFGEFYAVKEIFEAFGI